MSRMLATWWISGGRRPSEEPGGLQSGGSCRAEGGAGAAGEAGRSRGRASPEHEEEEEEREEEEEGEAEEEEGDAEEEEECGREGKGSDEEEAGGGRWRAGGTTAEAAGSQPRRPDDLGGAGASSGWDEDRSGSMPWSKTLNMPGRLWRGRCPEVRGSPTNCSTY